MARIDKSLMRQWRDEDVVRSTDYNRERDLIVEAVNDIEDKLAQTGSSTSYVTKQTMDDAIAASASADHLGTWQGKNPSDFVLVGTEITPELIGAVPQADFNALEAEVNNFLAYRTNLTSYPRQEGETDDKGRFQRAIDGTPAGGELLIPDGTYYADSIVINKPISLIFEGQALIESTVPDVDIFTFQGTASTNTYVLSQALNRGDRTIKLTKYPLDIFPGDMIILQDDTVRVSDGQPNVNVESHEIIAVTSVDPNLVVAPAMNVDTDANGTVDSFLATSLGSPTVTRVLDDTEQAQRIQITASTTAGSWAAVYQEVPVTAGKYYNLGVDVKVDSAATVEGRYYISWYDDTGSLNQYSEFTYFTSTGLWQTSKIYNQQAPTGSTKARIYFQAYCRNGGETGSVWFKNAVLQESNTELTIRDYVRLPKSIASSNNVYKVIPLENVSVHNFRYRLKEGSTTGRGLFMDMVRAPYIHQFLGMRGAESAIQIRRSMYAVIDGFSITSPQVTGSGQGYGIQFYEGNNGVVVRNGFCMETRHAVDFEGTADAIVENVASYNGAGADFVMSHNGWTSDIAFYRCRAINGQGQGFVANSQGVSDPLSLTFYNMNVIDCDVITANNSQAGVHFYSPAQRVTIRGFKMKYLNGAQGDYATMGNSGIRIYPGKTDALIDGCYIEGVRRGIALQAAGSVSSYENDGSKIIVRDTTVRNADSVVLIEKVTLGQVQFYNLNADGIARKVFEFSASPTFRSFVVDGLSLTSSPNAFFFTGTYTQVSDGARGVIRNIRTDRTNSQTVAAEWSLTDSNIYLYGDGETVLLTGGTASATTGNVFPPALVEGQRLFIMNTTAGQTITINPGANILLKNGAASQALATTGTTVAEFIWRGGASGKWVQV